MDLNNVDKWRKVKISDLFQVGTGYGLTKKQRQPGDIPFVSASKFDNGIVDDISNPDNLTLGKPNTITVSMTGSIIALYHDKPYLCSNAVAVLTPRMYIHPQELKFIAAIITYLIRDFDYFNQLNRRKVRELCIYIPYTSYGERDFGFMCQFVNDLSDKSDQHLDYMDKMGWL